jgi:hypothetical protein
LYCGELKICHTVAVLKTIQHLFPDFIIKNNSKNTLVESEYSWVSKAIMESIANRVYVKPIPHPIL